MSSFNKVADLLECNERAVSVGDCPPELREMVALHLEVCKKHLSGFAVLLPKSEYERIEKLPPLEAAQERNEVVVCALEQMFKHYMRYALPGHNN